MSLIKCIECGKEISDSARSCPNCGFRKPLKPLSKLEKNLIIIGICGYLIGIVGLCVAPFLTEFSYPNYKTYTTYDNNGLIGYDSNGNEIRGHTSRNHHVFGDRVTDYTKANIVAGFSVSIIIITTVYIIVKYKKNKNQY